ncbi:hypothetical protein ACIQB5_29730 [Streptomyces sp. NPDC088560]|uniref:hypothetical protein n=1 Tax=Streptomyces sp. NPDC088560 TaxID=3365868 RepID=UPI0038268C89
MACTGLAIAATPSGAANQTRAPSVIRCDGGLACVYKDAFQQGGSYCFNVPTPDFNGETYNVCRGDCNVTKSIFAAADLTHLTRVIKRKLKKNPDRTVRIQYRPHLIDGCLPPTGLIMDYDATRSSVSASST